MDSLTFIGTATTLRRIGPFTLLTYPNLLAPWPARAHLGKGLWSRRLTDQAMKAKNLPVLDAIVLSHLHGDQGDRVARRQLDRTTAPALTTPHAAPRLTRQGFACRGLDTWSEALVQRDGQQLRVHDRFPDIDAAVLHLGSTRCWLAR